MTAKPYVQTVRGPIDPSELGQTLMHEHIVADWDYGLGKAPQMTSVDVVPKIVECMEAARAVGIGTVVDVSTENFALSPLVVRIAADQTGVNIVATTGVYKALAMPLPGWAYPPATAEEIAEHLVSSATNGLGETGIKPGILKVATNAGHISPAEETIIRGAAIAQRESGLPLTTHTSSTIEAEDQVAILKDAGADMERVVIGHVGLRAGIAGYDVYEKLLQEGVSVGIDNFGIIRPDEEYAEIVVRLVEAGHVDQVILSHDTTVVTRGMEGLYQQNTLKDPNFVGLPDANRIPPALPEGDFTMIHVRLLPLLKSAGVDEAMVTKMLVDNPRRMLTIDPARYQ